MSSWKNAAKSNQKVHRERHQPESRQHLGLLEKKKDYKKRARDHHDKAATLKILARRALNKNPDEFYYHMINSKTKKGVHHEISKPDEYTPEQLKLMQTQDMKYVNHKRTIEARKVEKLQSTLHLIDEAEKVQNSHIFFVDDAVDKSNFDLAKRLDTHPSLIHHRTNRIRLADLEKINLPDVDEKTLQAVKQEKEKSYKELAKRLEREKQLTVIQQKMEMKRHLANKSTVKPKLVKPGTKDSAPLYKWKYERKK